MAINPLLVTPELMDHWATNHDLVVVAPFGIFKTGDRITDPEKVVGILVGHNDASVVKVLKEAPPPVEPIEAA